LPAGGRLCGGPFGQEAEVIQKPLKCGLNWAEPSSHLTKVKCRH
jgi:hypothetical protein